MTPEEFTPLISRVTGAVEGRALDDDLARFLDETFPHLLPQGEIEFTKQ
jgi:hypothetical protein